MPKLTTTLDAYEVWFLTGSQNLYGEETLRQVAEQSQVIARELGAAASVPVKIVWKDVLKDSESIRRAALDANSDDKVIGLIAWMHTFSPAKMWISGLDALQKPLLHLHTQANVELPWSEIDFDFMNLNQAAHGDREFGYIQTRLGISRKTVVGHVSNPVVQEQVGTWMRAAAGWAATNSMKLARYGDNMRYVAVTEGDKTEAEIRFGVQVNTWGVNELAEAVHAASDADIDALVAEYEELYDVVPELRKGAERHESLRYGAAIEIGLRTFLEAGGFHAFTTSFEDLGALRQLPGLAVQRLMAEGYGFGAEGDWKTAILVLEVSPSLTTSTPTLEVHPLGIGGKEDPVRLVFNTDPGTAVVVAMSDMRDRFRLTANVVDVIEPAEALPKLPVGRAVWKPRPDFATSAAAWLTAGAAHHTVMSTAVGIEVFRDFAEMAKTELLIIDESTSLPEFQREVRWNQAYYRLAQGL
jgi:L-arabinose isomerase